MTQTTTPGEVLGRAVWNGGRWAVEDGTGQHISVLEGVERDQVTRAIAGFRAALEADDVEVGDVDVKADLLIAYGPDTTDSAGGSPIPVPPADYVGMLRLISDLADTGLPMPRSLDFWRHYQGVDVHLEDNRPADVSAWAAAFGLPEPRCTQLVDGSDRVWRTYATAGGIGDFEIRINSYVDITADGSGLEGTGWLEQVWVAAARKGISAHRTDDGERTVCRRSMRTGERTTARQAQDRWGATFGCKRCWPQGSPITAEADGGAA